MKLKKESPTKEAGSHHKSKQLVLNHIINQVEKGTGKTLPKLKNEYCEDKLFYVSLRYVTTTKKALCMALGIPVEAACRYKRKQEKKGLLVESADKVPCPYTGDYAHLISTNPKEFPRLLKKNVIQLRCL